MIRKRLGGFLSLCLIGVLLFSFAVPVSADYYYSPNEVGFQQTPDLYEVSQVISDIGEGGMLNDPTDMFIEPGTGDVYILDSGNSRVVVLDKNGKFVRDYKGTYGKDNLPLNKPQGLFITENDIYIADTDNSRVLHIGKDGEYIEEFVQPTADTYDTSYAFKPSKVSIDDKGVIYIANAFDWHGLLTLNADNDFLGYIAASKIQLSLKDRLMRIFATAEQQEQFARVVPPYFSNFLIAPDGFIYSVSYWAQEDQIKKLTPSGNNCYAPGMYGEKNKSKDFNGLPGLVDVAVDNYGFVYAADSVGNKIAVYDQTGHNVAFFGGSANSDLNFGDNANTKKHFNRIASIACDEDSRLWVLDGSLGIIQVVRPTDFMARIQQATYYSNRGEYAKSYEIWERVKDYDDLHYLANVGIAKAKFREGKLTEAMQIYKDQYVKTGYSEVFEDYRLALFRDHFLLVCLVALGLLALVTWVIKRASIYAHRISSEALPVAGKWHVAMYFRLTVLMLFHPIDAFDKIKQYRKSLKIWPIVSCIALIVVTRLANTYWVHFPLTTRNLIYTNWWQQIAVFFIPLVTWICMSYALSVTSEGKQTMKECLTVSFMAFVPYILLSYPLLAVSYLMDSKQFALYVGLSTCLLLWSVMLLLTSSMRMNEYSFGKVLWMAIKSVFGMLCVWMIVFLFYIVLYQFWQFLTDIYFECSLLFSR